MHPIYLSYPINPQPRYGYGKPVHPELDRIIGAKRDQYAAWLTACLRYQSFFQHIDGVGDDEGTEPFFKNDYLVGLDACALYALLAQRNPKRYLEIGSGHSTKFARRAIRDQGLRTQITSIDPTPRAACDQLCDRVIRQSVETLDLAIFEELEAGDVLFVDHSHYVFTNSDSVVVFLDILPRLKPGVLVQIHDIWLPADYPPKWSTFYFAEQYLLACWLLAGTTAFEIVLACGYCSLHPELQGILAPIWEGQERYADIKKNGASFWFEMKQGRVLSNPFLPPVE